MRNIKKLIAAVITVAMIASFTAVPALAAETPDALKLEAMGVLKGTGNGVDAAYRASIPMRYQAAWLFLRLLGKEADAKASAATANFGDAASARTAAGNPLDAANKTMLAYLFANQTLGFQGYTDQTFRPFVQINAQMYYKLMLVALGYVEGTDFTWNNVFDKVVAYGLTTTKPSNTGTFNIDALARTTVQALQAKIKDQTMSLLDKLINVDKAVTPNAAAKAGLYSRVLYTSALDPVVNLGDDKETLYGPPVATQYMLPEIYTGIVTIRFDMKSLVAGPDAMVGFVAAEVVPTFRYYENMSIQVAMGSTFKVINGGVWANGPAVAMGTTYHVRIVADLNAFTYDVFINDAAVGAGDFTFRWRNYPDAASQDPAVLNATNLSMVVVAGDQGDMIQMSNLVITDNTP